MGPLEEVGVGGPALLSLGDPWTISPPPHLYIVGPDELTHGAPRPLQVAVGVGR